MLNGGGASFGDVVEDGESSGDSMQKQKDTAANNNKEGRDKEESRDPDVVRSRTGGVGLGTNDYKTSVVAPFDLPSAKPGVTFGISSVVSTGGRQEKERGRARERSEAGLSSMVSLNGALIDGGEGANGNSRDKNAGGERKRSKSPFGILKKLGHVVSMSRDDDDEHALSVQVTVTREFERTQEVEIPVRSSSSYERDGSGSRKSIGSSFAKS
jgi:hypothetical protein